MGLFGLFGKKEEKGKQRKGFHLLTVSGIEKLTEDAVKISFEVPAELADKYVYKAGQYLDVSVTVNETEELRSYSICSGQNENLSIGVKQLENGKVSAWLNQNVKTGDQLSISEPRGNFVLNSAAKKIVLIAAGSGITPVLSMAKGLSKSDVETVLVYGNRTERSIMFKNEIEALSSLRAIYFLSGETKEGYRSGRIDKENFTALIKEDLDLLKADGFYLCGPEGMISEVRQVLEFFGVKADKIHFELFTTPVEMTPGATHSVAAFSGISQVTAILDGEKVHFSLDAKGPTLLEASDKAGMDAPYSCKGGVCCSCRAKVLKGSAAMNVNYALTDEEVAQGYILTCQAHPTSEELTFSYDD
jgi:ring-1,2-phenylacetyl-CoA epoxidase subunit PaaE